MNRQTALLALLCLTACNPTPGTPATSSPSPAASASPAAKASTAPAASATPTAAPAAQGGALHFTFTDSSTAKPNPGTSYDAVSIFATAAANNLAASTYAHADGPSRNVTITLGTAANKVGDAYPLQSGNPFAPGYMQYADSDGANVQPKTFLWIATGGTLKIEAVDGKTVSFSITNATMVPRTDSSNPNSSLMGGTFTINGSGKVDVPAS
jgi:hypothetical protein